MSINYSNVKFREYRFQVGDTINGILKAKSNLPLEEAKKLFYNKNGFKNFKVGQLVYIPYVEEN